MSSLARFIVLMAFSEAALAAGASCYGTKAGHPMPGERAAFVQEVSGLAVGAEKKHGVPAAAVAALAIIESGYGWTPLALEANNLFAWKAGASDVQKDQSYVPACQRRRKANDHFVIFANRADAFDLVAAKLATLDGYREYTQSYREARKRGEPVDRAVKAWVAGIAKRYSRKPDEFTEKMIRVMNDPQQHGETVSRDQNLYELSRKVGVKQ